jgi:hypothetical protein
MPRERSYMNFAPRDGLQTEPGFVPTPDKATLIDAPRHARLP